MRKQWMLLPVVAAACISYVVVHWYSNDDSVGKSQTPAAQQHPRQPFQPLSAISSSSSAGNVSSRTNAEKPVADPGQGYGQRAQAAAASPADSDSGNSRAQSSSNDSNSTLLQMYMARYQEMKMVPKNIPTETCPPVLNSHKAPCWVQGCNASFLPLQERLGHLLRTQQPITKQHRQLIDGMADHPEHVDVAFLTAASSNHFDETQGLIKDLHQQVFPELRRQGGHTFHFFYYDLGLTPRQLLKLKAHCNCTVLPFPFAQLPSQFHKLGTCIWKPLVLKGPEKDQEPETELSVTELKQQTARLKRETEVLKQAEMEEEEERERQRQKILELRGCSWGMGEDATEEDEDNPFPVTSLVPEHEHLYKDDPKKALKGFYEREGCDLPDYQFTEVGFGKHKCIVELPVDGPNGEVLTAEATVSGKKKDAVVACALEACRLLDMHGMLHASKHESKKRKAKNWADDDFYDSDEDTFLDRTGTIEKKRIYRMKKSGKEEKAETYDTLVPQHEEVQKRIAEIELKLEQAKAQSEAMASEEDDALDAYMSAIKMGVMDTKTRLSLKRELLTLKTEEQRLRKLVNLARPADMPELKKLESGLKKPAVSAGVASGTRKIGMAKGPKKPVLLPATQLELSTDEGFQEEEEEEEDDKGPDSNMILKSPSPASRVLHDSVCKDPVPENSNPCVPSSQTVKDTDDSRQKPSVLASVKELASQVASTKGAKNRSNSELKGPGLPSAAEHSALGRKQSREKEPVSSESSQPSLEAPREPPAKKRKKSAIPHPKKVDYDDSDPNYAMWMPPQDQSGDGRTSLNDKLGY